MVMFWRRLSKIEISSARPSARGPRRSAGDILEELHPGVVPEAVFGQVRSRFQADTTDPRARGDTRCAPPDRYNPLHGAAVGPPLEPGTRSVPRRGDHEKEDLFEYYRAIAPVLVPHLRNRPFTMKRSPCGVAGTCTSRRQAPGDARLDPDAHVPHLPAQGRVAARPDFPLVNSPEALLWMVQIELHRHERLVLARRQAAPPDTVSSTSTRPISMHTVAASRSRSASPT